MTTRQYSSRSQQSTLTGSITSGATSITVVSGTALLGGVTIPAGRTFTLVIDPDTALEEIVDATAISTNTFTITRGIDGSTGQNHSAGAVVRHMAIGRDYRDANLHAEADASYNDGSGNAHTMHGIGAGEGVVVGTLKTQTLTNKTLTAPTIHDPVFTGTPTAPSAIIFEGTNADPYETTLTVTEPTQDNTITLPDTTGIVVLTTAAQTLTNKTIDMTGVTLTGLSSTGMVNSSATPKNYVDSILGSATAASTSAASALVSANSAAASATAASTSAVNASTSAVQASTSAASASVSAIAANTSAIAASTSAASALVSANSASASMAAVQASAVAAQTSAASASASASAANASAVNASTSAASASVSQIAANTSAINASTSAASASVSAIAASTSAANAAVSAASAAAAVTTAIQASIVDAKGDLIVGSGPDAVARLAVGTDGHLLTASSTAANGIAWTAAPAGYLAPTIGSTVINSGTTVTTLTAVTLSNASLTGTLTAASTSGANGQYLKSTGSGVEWATVQAGSQVRINGGTAVTYDFIDFAGMGTNTATTGTIRVSPVTVTDAKTAGVDIFVGTVTPTGAVTGDIWIDESNNQVDLETMMIMGAY